MLIRPDLRQPCENYVFNNFQTSNFAMLKIFNILIFLLHFFFTEIQQKVLQQLFKKIKREKKITVFFVPRGYDIYTKMNAYNIVQKWVCKRRLLGYITYIHRNKYTCARQQIKVSEQKQQDRTAAQNPTAQLNLGRAENEGANN